MIKNKACIIIPMYRSNISEFEQISMHQCFKILGNHDIYYVIPKKLEVSIKANEYVRNGKASYKVFDDDFFVDIMAYNRLLKFTGFYKAFLAYEFMLIYQLDAFVFKDELLHWCNKGNDSIGAPLFEGLVSARPDSPIIGQGNGGFCLRNIHRCYEIVTQFKKLKFTRTFEDSDRPFYINLYRYIKHQLIYIYSGYPFQPIINEDLFWAEVIPENFPDFRLPSIEDAIKFSFEVNPDFLFEMNGNELPFGCHAWWKYNLDFWLPHINKFGYNIKAN
ncbi:MAG: hypothetical protein EOP55_03500 [Sphingobacteriales bacterium]|nr:MAG: hypothetical protein EOP55_03500 [Sphingobacteriales bacterium]